VFSPPPPEAPPAGPVPVRDNPLQLLRDAIDQLKSPNGGLPDQEQVAKLLAEAREALEHANVVSRAASQCDAAIQEAQFEKAFEVLDEGLRAYPDDPTLLLRRRAVAEQEKAFHSAAAAKGAIEEANWLLNQDRTDLATQFLKEKSAELPDQQELTARLLELEALLPSWEEKRHVQDALARAGTLEVLEQWQAALTVIEEALQPYPRHPELKNAAKRLRSRLADHDRRKKLARRVELIRQQIVARSWRQALTLLENTQIEFPDARELKPLRQEITTGLKRAECDEIVAEVKKCLADSELEPAEQVLRRGLAALGAEPSLEALQAELETEKKYRDELRHAQVLFGRRQFEEAERVLIQSLDPNRPEANALLNAVRAARAASEEENFLERGREKALAMVQQQQYAQAADLLRNLLALFPGNPILERDLAAALSSVGPIPAAEATAAIAEEEPPARPEPIATRAVAQDPTRRARRAAIAGAASLALVTAVGAGWKLTHPATPASRPAAAPAAASAPVTTPPTVVTQEAAPPSSAPSQPAAQPQPAPPHTAAGDAKPQPHKPEPATPVRPFVPPPNSAPVSAQNAALPAAPGINPSITVTSIPGMPTGMTATINAPAPPPAAAPAPAVPEVKTPLPPGGKIEPAVLINRTMPDYPSLARQRALTGVVKLTAAIDERGNVKDVKYVSGDAVLAAAAKNAVWSWKYKPARLNGKAISATTEIQIVFGDRNK